MKSDKLQLLEVATKAAREAGAILQKYFAGNLLISRKEGIGNIVTIADRQSENTIVEIIRKHFPDHDILGEEGSSRHSGSSYLWSIDSLDGTSTYNNKLPWFAVSIGVLKENQPHVGVVYIPFGLFGEGELYTAIRGKGSFLNGEKIRVSSKKALGDAFVGFDYTYSNREEHIRKLLIPLASHTRATTSLYWATGQLCYVARGLLDGYIHGRLLHWDIAAATLIVEEAGGKVTDLAGKPLVWEIGKTFDYCASNGKIHDQLLEKIA